MMLLATLYGCKPTGQTSVSPSSSMARVDPAHYDAFFLWAGVGSQTVLARARTIYILDGEVRAGGRVRLTRLRAATPHVRHASVWLTIRLERLDWDEGTWQAVLGELARWQKAGNVLVGLQLDFDAHTHGLSHYADFLATVRKRLAFRYRLSITGLLDWSASGDPAQLARLGPLVDEIVIQTYQGRQTIPGYEAYLDSLRRLRLPYRIGLVEGGLWNAPPGLRQDPHFRGYVVFLLPGRTVPRAKHGMI